MADNKDGIYGSLGVVDTVEGVAIHATNNGKFAAFIEGREVRLASKSALAKRIRGSSKPVDCMKVYDTQFKPDRRNVTGITRGKYEIRVRYRRAERYGGTGEDTERAHGYYLYDADAFAALEAIAAEAKMLRERRDAIVNGLTRLTAREWDEAQLERRVAAAEAEA